jgi:hypothetical protein
VAANLKHPFVRILVTFIAVFVGVYLIPILFLLWVLLNDECRLISNNPCDGLGLLVVGLMTVTFPIALFVGVISAVITGIVLAMKENKSQSLP